MKKTILLLSVFLCILTIKGYAQQNHDNEILVFFDEGVSQEIKLINGKSTKVAKLTKEKLKQSLMSVGITDTLMEVALPKFIETDTLKVLEDGTKIKQPNMTKLYRVKITNGKKRDALINYLKQQPEILYAEPNGKAAPNITPNDTRFSEQWGLSNSIHASKDIHAKAAWDIYTGNPNNIIAIIDGGTQSTHLDLQNKISAGDTGFGWDGHGIHVSGIAAASSNNSIGISGVDWNALIHPQRIDEADDADIYQAIVDAVNYSPNVYVLNNSWELVNSDGTSGRNSTTVRQAFAYAYKANRTSVVAPAGAVL